MIKYRKKIGLFLFLTIYATWVYKSGQKADISICKAVAILDKSTINGKLIYNKSSNGGHSIQVENDSTVYEIVIADIKSDDVRYSHVRRIGESIIKKKSFSDSLFVINKDRTYAFKVYRIFDHCKD